MAKVQIQVVKQQFEKVLFAFGKSMGHWHKQHFHLYPSQDNPSHMHKLGEDGTNWSFVPIQIKSQQWC